MEAEKMSDTTIIIEEIRKCGEALTKIAEVLSDNLEETSSDQETPTVQETSETMATEPKEKITLEEVRAVLAEKSRNGFTTEVKALIRKFGVEKLSDIEESRFADVLAEVEAIK